MATKQQSEPSEISFSLVNNTNSNILMSFLSNPTNTQDISNQFTEYSWNITSIASNLSAYDTIILTFSNGSSVTTTIYNKTLDGIIVALNLLGVSSFYYEVISGSTYIKTYNDIQGFTTLEITSSTAVAGVQLFYSILLPFAFTNDGGTQITNSGTFDTGTLNNPQSVPTTNATSLISLSDNILTSGATPSIGVSIICGVRVIVDEIVGVTTTNISDETFYNSGYSATPFTLSNNNATYDVSVVYPDLDANYYISTSSTNGSVSIDYGQPSVPILLNPITQLADYTTSISAGQLVQVAGVAPNSGGVLTIRIRIRSQNISTGAIATISDNTYSNGASFNNSFTISNGFAYQIFITDL
jgi:hypothetical protein